jgi:hypothetical protein
MTLDPIPEPEKRTPLDCTACGRPREPAITGLGVHFGWYECRFCRWKVPAHEHPIELGTDGEDAQRAHRGAWCTVCNAEWWCTWPKSKDDTGRVTWGEPSWTQVTPR